MAGTDGSQPPDRPSGEPVVILVAPQLGENVGAAARAMLNCGLRELRLVRPRDGWPNPAAYAAASGADEVLDRLRVFRRVEDAVEDLHRVLATTTRRRDLVKEVVTPPEAAIELRRLAGAGQRAGVLFGPERIGLTNDQVALADVVVTAPLNPRFSSLNLAQAVLLVAYEWLRAADRTPRRSLEATGHPPATRDQLFGFFDHLERALEAAGFFKVGAMRPVIVRNLRNLFHRAGLTDQEVRTLHGVVTALVGRRRDQL